MERILYFYHFHWKIYLQMFEKQKIDRKHPHFSPNDKNCPIDPKKSYFATKFKRCNFEDKRCYFQRKNISKSVNESKYNIFFQNILLSKHCPVGLLHLMCAIACTHASSHITSFICVKNSMHYFCL